MSESALQFCYGWTFCNALDLLKEIVGEREADYGCPGLEFAMEIVGNVTKLDHL
jgi:hypothetical protein